MTGAERPWDDLHHQSYFLLDLHEVESKLSNPSSSGSVHKILNSLAPSHIFSKSNMSNILETILVNISKNPNIIENIFIGVSCSLEEIKIYTNIYKEFRDLFAWSYEEMHGIDPLIV